jgi:hypothetical protein
MNSIKFKPNIKKINHLKRDRRVTNRQIAKDRGVSEVWVSYVIHGKGKSEPLEEDISKALGVDRKEIFPGPKRAA